MAPSRALGTTLLLLLITVACRPPAPVERGFVGSARCGDCHPAEADAWQGSHHARALAPATPETVLAPFDGRSWPHPIETASFTRHGDRFLATVAGRELPVVATLGFEPLQQYLVELPGGRLQPLSWAWDDRPAAAGGQRFFSLTGDEPVPPGDSLHWAGRQQNANSMCLECHTTGFEKGYDAATDTFRSRWAEGDVGCEACHGPGARHVAWAEGDRADPARGLERTLADPGRAGWRLDTASGQPRRDASSAPAAQIEVCAECHSRRTPIAPAASPGRLLDRHRPALLEPGLYHPDGQIDGEVFEVGSFEQSAMHRAGVSCGDCHEPHSGVLRRTGNALCTSCHPSPAFDTPAHHHHPEGSAAAQCVSCHMPSKTYLGVDDRRDHSLRIPRPDLSIRLGTPNACNDCHEDRPASWAARAVADWFGAERRREPHWGEVLAAGRARAPEAGAALATLAEDSTAPVIARATAVSLLATNGTPRSREVLVRSLGHGEATLRLAALGALAASAPEERSRLAAPLLADPLRAVRIEAARVLATARPSVSAPGFEPARAELLAAFDTLAERPEASLNRGVVVSDLGDLLAAEAAFVRALALDPEFVPASLNLADILRRRGSEGQAEALLLEVAERAPADARVQLALGLLRIRTGRLEQAIPSLARAAELDPSEPRYAATLALALEARAVAPGH